MDFTVIICWQFLVAALAIFALVSLIRGSIEEFFPKIKENRFWRDLFLPFAGIIVGILFGLAAVPFPWPLGLTGTFNRTIFSMICGMFSSSVYKAAKAFISGAIENIKATIKERLASFGVKTKEIPDPQADESKDALLEDNAEEK